MTAIVFLSIALLTVAAALCLLAVLRGRTLADRSVGLDAAVSVMMCALAAAAVRTGDDLFVDIALVLGLVGFLATVTTARYIGRRGL